MEAKRHKLTAADITSAIKIYFSYRGTKLFRYEPHKRKFKGEWIVNKKLGYPKGTPDLMGWRVKDGRTTGVEIKTITDTIKSDQIKMKDVMLHDNCEYYIAKEMPGDKIELWNCRTDERIVVRP